jgi:hypothetical protein
LHGVDNDNEYKEVLKYELLMAVTIILKENRQKEFLQS